MKLSELQAIAKAAKTIKFNGVKKETLIGKILEHQTVKADPSLDFKMESWRMIKKSSVLFPLKRQLFKS
jgi:transcription termination factor Rho